MVLVFLSGRLTSDWQDRVREAVPSASFIDPRSSGLTDPREYTAWNLASVDRAEIVFAYMERENPSGYGLALEVGYAVARGKQVIVADERSAHDPEFAQRFVTVREAAAASFDALDPALSMLARLVQQAER